MEQLSQEPQVEVPVKHTWHSTGLLDICEQQDLLQVDSVNLGGCILVSNFSTNLLSVPSWISGFSRWDSNSARMIGARYSLRSDRKLKSLELVPGRDSWT